MEEGVTLCSDSDFASYYRREMRWAAIAMFALVGINYALAPLYRHQLLGTPEPAPLINTLLEQGLIVSLCVIVVYSRWRWPDRLLSCALTMLAVAGVGAAIVASRYLWAISGVPFFNELIGYFLIGAMAMTGIEFRRLCWVAMPLLLADTAVSYALHGRGPVANFEMLSNFTAANVCFFVGWFAERNMRRVWTETGALERLARHDELTRLLNRRGFEDRAQEALRQAARDTKPVAMALVDLDHFKPYNDRYGHPAGDEALRSVARVLAAHARRPLDLVARFGGDEFVVLWFDATAQGAELRARALVEAVCALDIAHELTGNNLRCLSISLGAITGTPTPATRVTQLIELADRHLYEAKQRGRNQAVVAAMPGRRQEDRVAARG